MTGGRLVGPAVNLWLKKYGIRVTQIGGTGPHGTVSKGDVLKFALGNNLKVVPQDAAPVSFKIPSSSGLSVSSDGLTSRPKLRPIGPSAFHDVEISNMRRTIAKRLLQSKSTIPHAYGITECNVEGMSAIRKQLASDNMKVSVNDIIIKCTANALMKVPAVNCIWDGENLRQRNVVDIAVAVATPNGLITPIIFDVGDRDVVQISEAVKVLATKAKDGKLQPHEFMGGTFSISNLGMFGIYAFTAIINPPQCAILAVGGNIVSIDGKGKATTNVQLQLSYDARAISEQDSAKFLGNLKSEIENVSELSLGIYDMRFKKESLELRSVFN